MTAREKRNAKRIFLKICLLAALVIALVLIYIYRHKADNGEFMKVPTKTTETVAYYSTSTTSPKTLPVEVLLNDNYYAPQTFNNCGPAALSMDLSYYGVDVSQEALADALRPDHNTTGKDDDKSTPPEEIAAQTEQYGLIAYYRPAGSIELLKQLLAAGFPVLTRTLFMPTDQVAHYRVIKGYNDATQQITDEDGFQGPNVTYSYSDFSALWKYYNYEYIVLIPPQKQAAVEAILGPDANAATAWQQAAANAENGLAQNPGDVTAKFDLSVALYYTGDYADSAKDFESVQTLIPPDALWYQMEPLETYYELGEYDKVFSLSQYIFDNGNPAYPELYVLRGDSYLKEGNPSAAKAEFEKAIFYNPNLASAKAALAAMGTTQ